MKKFDIFFDNIILGYIDTENDISIFLIHRVITTPDHFPLSSYSTTMKLKHK